MPRVYLLIAAGLFASAATGSAQSVPGNARFTFDVVPQSPNTVSAGTIFYTPGQQLRLNVFLREPVGGGTGVAPTTNTVLGDEHGLFGGGVRLTFGTSGVVSVSGNSAGSIVYNPQFNDTGTNTNAANRTFTANYAEFRAVSDGTQAATADAANGYRVLLGTFVLDAAAGGGATTLTASVPSYTNANVTFDNGLIVPYGQTDAAVYVLTPVPESSSVLIVAALALSAVFTAGRRWPSGV